jgi:hypothetical protein
MGKSKSTKIEHNFISLNHIRTGLLRARAINTHFTLSYVSTNTARQVIHKRLPQFCSTSKNILYETFSNPSHMLR